MFYFHSFTCVYQVLPAPLVGRTVFSLLYNLTYLVIDLLAMGEWIYFWVLYPVSFIHLSVFVPLQSLVAQRLKHLPGMWGIDPWVGKIPWARKWQHTPVLLPGESHGGRSLVGYSPWGHKESDTTERLHFDYYRFII